MAFSTHDIVPDSPTNNFCTLNPLDLGADATLSNGNLKIDYGSSATISTTTATFSVSKGKWYWEILSNINGSELIGITNTTEYLGDFPGHVSGGWGYYANDGKKFIEGTSSEYGDSWVNGDIIGFYLDMDAGTLVAYKNGVSQGTMVSGLTGNIFPAIGDGSGVTETSNTANFGQDPTFGGNKNTPATVNINGTNVTGPFAPSGTAAGTAGLFYYPPPADALALCTANLPDFTPDVTGDVPQDYFKVVKYTGQTTVDAGTWDSGTSTSTIAVGFQPDFVWLKQRDSSTSTHQLLDVVRGKIGNAASFSRLRTDTNAIEATPASDSGLLSMGSNGFTLGTDSTYNDSGGTYVAWCWKAGGAPNLTSSPTKPFAKNGVQYETLSAANITAGTITPTAMSVNTDAGFSIVKYTGNSTAGASVAHGLGQKPDCIIVKRLTGTSMNWGVYHHSLASNEILQLDVNNDVYADSGVFNGTQPTSSVFYLGGTTAIDNTSGQDYIAYCWHSVEGFSKFGSFTSASGGVYVYLGFKPALIISKLNGTGHWNMYDNARQPFNTGSSNVLFPDLPNEEGSNSTIYNFEFLSNGFRSFGTGSSFNSGTHLFIAFAEQPFKYANAR